MNQVYLVAQVTCCSQKVLDAVKPKKTKIGTPPLNQLVADASLVLEDENEVHLTVEIEVGSFL